MALISYYQTNFLYNSKHLQHFDHKVNFSDQSRLSESLLRFKNCNVDRKQGLIEHSLVEKCVRIKRQNIIQ